jgi:hypothetical protein
MDPVEPWIDGNAVRQLAAQLLSSPSGPEISDSPDAGFGPGFEGFTSAESATESRVAAAEVTALSVQVAEPPTPVSEPQREVSREPEVIEIAPEETMKEVEKGKPFLAAAEAAATVASEEEQEQDEGPGNGESDHPFQNIAKPAGESAGNQPKRGPLMERMLRFREWLCKHAGARSVFVLDRDGQPVLDDPAYAKLHFLARSLSQAYRPVPGQPGNVHVKVGSDAYLVVIPVETDFGCLVLGTVLPRPLDAPSVAIVAKGLVDAAKPQRS